MISEISEEKAFNWINNYEESRLWLGRFSSNTRAKYAKYLLRYSDFVGLDPNQLIELKRNASNHEAEKLLDSFVAEAPYPESTLWNISVAVKSFYKWNYEDLARACGKVSNPKQKPYRIPTQSELAKFIIGTNPRDKALILFMAATRIREETITLLDWSHVWQDLFEDPRDPPHIAVMSRILKGKGGKGYEDLEQHTFLTPDAKDALLKYRDWREERTGKTITPQSPLFAPIDEEKRLATAHIRKVFDRASKRTGLKFSPHDVGRFTQTQLEYARVQPNWIKKIVGHKSSGEENPYSQPKIEELREAYNEAVPVLTTKTKDFSREVNNLERELEETKLREKALIEQVDDLSNRLNHISESRKESDKVMNRLFEDPEFRELVKKKLKQLT